MISNFAERLMMSKMQSEVEGLLVYLDLRGMFPLSSCDFGTDESAHSLGNSLGGKFYPTRLRELMTVLRMFHKLGVRYMTLTHGCNNVFADSGGIFELPESKWNGLS